MRRVYVILLMAALCVSCSPRVVPHSAQSYICETVDSIGSVVKAVDVPIPAGEDSTSAPLRDTVFVTTQIAEATAWVDESSGRIHQKIRNLDWKDYQMDVAIPVYYHKKTEGIVRTETQFVEKPFVWWQTTLMGLGLLFLILAVILILLKILKTI